MTTHPPTPTQTPTADAASAFARLPVWATWLARLAAVAVLLAVFGLYMQPEFLVTLADQMWACL